MFEKILVAVDGSAHTTRTHIAVAELARTGTGQVRVVHVREAEFVGRGGEIADETSNDAHRIVDGVVDGLTGTGIKASGTVRSNRYGLAADEIMAEAKEWGATVIVMGYVGTDTLSRVLLGSTVHKVLELTEVPVLVVR